MSLIAVDRNRLPYPSFLSSPKAQVERQRMEELLDRSQSHIAQIRIEFDRKLRGQARRATMELFNSKCAYCETPLDRSDGDLDHFRPRRVAAQESGEKPDSRYYAWLNYEWGNMYASCTACNRRKSSRFPVIGKRAPIRASLEECRVIEAGTMVDPCYDYPNEHLTFDESGICTPLSPRGATTISILELNRTPLVHARRMVMFNVAALVKQLALLVNDKAPGAQGMMQDLAKLLGDEAPYAGAARACFEKNRANSWVGALQEHIDQRQRGPIATTIPTTAPVSRRPPVERRPPPRPHARLVRVDIRNFKALEHVSLKISRDAPLEQNKAGVLMLLGENATGKSSILEAIALAGLGTRNIANLGLNGADFLRRDSAWELVGKPAEIVLHFDEGEPVLLSIKMDGTFAGDAEQQLVVIGYGPRRYFSDRRGIRRAHGAAERVRTMFDPATVLTNPIRWLMSASEREFSASIAGLRKILMLPDDDFVERPVKGKRKDGELMLVRGGRKQPLRRMSEGFRTVVVTAVDIMRELLSHWDGLEDATGIVLIDELETHLHPRWKMRLMTLLREAMPNVQFIATTHDPLCLRGVFNGEVQVLRSSLRGGVEQVVDLPSIEGLSVEQLLTSDYFGLLSTEDPSVERDFFEYGILLEKTDRTAEEEVELEGLRGKFERRERFGATPQAQLVYESAAAVVARLAADRPVNRDTVSKEAADRMVDLWLRETPPPQVAR